MTVHVFLKKTQLFCAHGLNDKQVALLTTQERPREFPRGRSTLNPLHPLF